MDDTLHLFGRFRSLLHRILFGKIRHHQGHADDAWHKLYGNRATERHKANSPWGA